MDRIIIRDLSFYGYHGVLNEEKVLGQKFFIDIDIYCDLKKAGLSDNVDDTINYKLVYDIVKKYVENEKFDLIEALAESIASELLDKFTMIKELIITVKKPEAPVNGIFDYFGVEIRRSRDE